jgi:hypothetical protein
VSSITPIKLATAKQNNLERPGRNATVLGWGNTLKMPPNSPGAPLLPLCMHEAQCRS